MCFFALLERSLGKERCPPPSGVASFSFQEVSFEIFPVLRSLKENHQILLNLLINMETRVESFSPPNCLQWEEEKEKQKPQENKIFVTELHVKIFIDDTLQK